MTTKLTIVIDFPALDKLVAYLNDVRNVNDLAALASIAETIANLKHKVEGISTIPPKP